VHLPGDAALLPAPCVGIALRTPPTGGVPTAPATRTVGIPLRTPSTGRAPPARATRTVGIALRTPPAAALQRGGPSNPHDSR
jgi:hypothetical protein